MNNRPYGSELLMVARRTLLDELLPLLPADKTYDALMVANAMAIASRELEPFADYDPQAAQIIQGFFETLELNADDYPPTEDALAQLIRSGRLPSTKGVCLHGILLSLTRAKLLRSNPKYLRQ